MLLFCKSTLVMKPGDCTDWGTAPRTDAFSAREPGCAPMMQGGPPKKLQTPKFKLNP
jgi:hypothetical protein